jgi:HEPN domain-containing protein
MKTDFTNPNDWLYFAGIDLEAIDLLSQHRMAYEVCISKLAECLEKIIKAELTRNKWKLRKEHDLQWLAKEMANFSPDLTLSIQDTVETLADVYFSSRYPGFDLQEADWDSFAIHHQVVKSLFDKVKDLVSPRIDVE